MKAVSGRGILGVTAIRVLERRLVNNQQGEKVTSTLSRSLIRLGIMFLMMSKMP